MKKKLVSACLVGAMCLSLVACSSDKKNDTKTSGTANSYKAGTYTGKGTGNNGEVTVEVTFSDKKIEKIEVKDNKETEGIRENAFEKVPAAIIEGQSLAVDTVTGATNSSKAVLAAVEDCVKQAGGDVDALKTATTAKKDKEVVEESCDVVVVGAGAAGSAAALSAAENGAKVIIIEKTATVSGAGTMAGALFASSSDQQIAAKKTVDPEWLYDQYIGDSLYYANARLVRNIIEGSSETVNWLETNGVRLTLLDAGHGAQYNHVGMPATAHGYVDGGTVAIETLLEKVKKNGGEVMYETTGKSLIKNEDGTVGGVVAETSDKELHIKAGSVVLATGGYGGNEEWMKKYFGEKAGTGLIASATGDGIQMAWDAGAAEEGIEVAQWFGMSYGPEAKQMENSRELTELVRNPLLFVNKDGERFGNEEEAYESSALSTMIYQQPEGVAYIMVPESTVKAVAEKSLAKVFADRWESFLGKGVKFMEAGHVQDLDASEKALRTPKDYTATLEDAVKAGVAVKGNVKEIASTLGMDNLVSEITRYNKLCKAGKDTDFYKDAKYMTAIGENETVYAVKVKTRMLTTLGGVKINENIQAVDENNKEIANLYVAGSDAGGMYGNNYVVFEGGTLGFAYTSGRLAGENAAANVKSAK
ncbi:fumarate reductase flavoprotein subunit [Lachnospiraceae bacterium KM106-2]|nr:fumarate reductase flavoprotein subunit [Lachnospiraceae bacterium KM106-2]